MTPTGAFSLLESRIARRMLGLFVLCALIPTSILGWVSYRQVTDQLIQQTSARLKQESKSQGMALINHFLARKADLDRIAAELPSDKTALQDATLTATVQDAGHRFRELRLLNYGSPAQHQLDESQVNHLAAGKTLLRLRPGEDDTTAFILLRAVNPSRLNAGLLSALVDEQLLWQTQDKEILPPDTDLILEGSERQILYTTFHGQIALPNLQRQDLTRPMAETFVGQLDGHDQIVSTWTIPLRYHFLADPWVIALSQPKETALAPVDQFRHTFLFVMALALSVIVLLSLAHIRRSLHPVTLLQAGTMKLAEGDFSTRVAVHSRDEFEDLANSFNRMTGQLSRQFHTLETLAAISQAILSSQDPRATIRLVQSRISDSLSCEAVGMALLQTDRSSATVLSVLQLNAPSGEPFTEAPCLLSPSDLAFLEAHPRHALIPALALPEYLETMAAPGDASVALFPIMVDHFASGLLALAFRQGTVPSKDELAAVRRLADHVAVALATHRAMEARLRAQLALTGAVDAQHHAEEQASALQAANRQLATKEERLQAQQRATLALVKDRTVFEDSLAATAKQITETAAQSLAADWASIWIFDEVGQVLYCLDRYGRSGNSHGLEHPLIPGQYPVYFDALRRESAIAADQAQHHESFREFADAFASKPITSRLDAPFFTKTGLAGVITIEHVGDPREWAQDEEQFARALANLMTLILEATRRREAEDALALAKLAAEDAANAKAEFLANMSHEIRTPMNGVIGMTEILARTSLSNTQRHYVETIRNSGDTLLALINDILDFSKIEAGKLEIQPVALDLRDLVERTAEQLAGRAQQKGLHLLAEYDPAVPTAVIGDPIRIRQILTNLLGNAIKFTQQGDVRVSVTVDSSAPRELGPAIFRIAVTDTGTGISPEGQARLFQSFSQVDGSSTRVHGGTGLGLSICKQLSQLMGGGIAVQSGIGQGSTFSVTLPLPLQAEPDAERRDDAALAEVRICAAVSHPQTRRLLTHYLSSWGLVPQIADTGAEFLEQIMNALATEGGQVIALIDETFADMTDIHVLQDLRSDAALADAVILRLLSFTRRAEAEQDPAFGQIPFVTKPIRYDALHAALQSLLGKPPLPSASPLPTPLSTPRLAGAVLLAEDNPVNQEIATLMLENLGCSVTVAQSGREAVESVKKARYDMVLMDCQMPGMDGFEATRLIRAWESELCSGPSTRPIPIVALTAHATTGDRDHCLASGMNDYLSKPFTMEQLQRIVALWLTPNAAPEIPTLPGSTETTDAPPAAIEPAAHQTIDRQAWQSITALQRPGKPDMLAKILTLYLTDSQQLVDQIRRGVAAGEARLVNEAAHSLKSRSAVLGAVSLSDLCCQIEAISRREPLTDAEPLLNPLDTAFTHACMVFQTECDKRAA
ncbi:MAG: response regulator [Nitrospira sp.]|nr:response regulator [Nitrospira sp.]